MGLFDFLKVGAFKAEIERLEVARKLDETSLSESQAQNRKLSQLVSDVELENSSFKATIEVVNTDNKRLNKAVSELGILDLMQKQALMQTVNARIAELDNTHSALVEQIVTDNNRLASLQQQIIITDETILLQSFGLYVPIYEFANSEMFQERLADLRQRQETMVKAGKAATGSVPKHLFENDSGARSSYLEFVELAKKLALRAFNSECDNIVASVKYSNFESHKKRIEKSQDILQHAGNDLKQGGYPIGPSHAYMRLKIEELELAHEYRLKLQDEKDAQKEARAQLREAKKLEKEIEDARRAIEKEKKHYANAITALKKQLLSVSGVERDALIVKQAELVAKLEDLDVKLKDIDYREANQKAGFVYVISNIGAFGENVFKIGVTRRLDAQERIDDLGDASVPFEFDVHAIIFSDDAFSLERHLHQKFATQKVNLVNQRREFFIASLDEIKGVIRDNFDKTVEWIDVPQAEQYRASKKMRLAVAAQ